MDNWIRLLQLSTVSVLALGALACEESAPQTELSRAAEVNGAALSYPARADTSAISVLDSLPKRERGEPIATVDDYVIDCALLRAARPCEGNEFYPTNPWCRSADLVLKQVIEEAVVLQGVGRTGYLPPEYVQATADAERWRMTVFQYRNRFARESVTPEEIDQEMGKAAYLVEPHQEIDVEVHQTLSPFKTPEEQLAYLNAAKTMLNAGADWSQVTEKLGERRIDRSKEHVTERAIKAAERLKPEGAKSSDRLFYGMLARLGKRGTYFGPYATKSGYGLWHVRTAKKGTASEAGHVRANAASRLRMPFYKAGDPAIMSQLADPMNVRKEGALPAWWRAYVLCGSQAKPEYGCKEALGNRAEALLIAKARPVDSAKLEADVLRMAGSALRGAYLAFWPRHLSDDELTAYVAGHAQDSVLRTFFVTVLGPTGESVDEEWLRARADDALERLERGEPKESISVASPELEVRPGAWGDWHPGFDLGFNSVDVATLKPGDVRTHMTERHERGGRRDVLHVLVVRAGPRIGELPTTGPRGEPNSFLRGMASHDAKMGHLQALRELVDVEIVGDPATCFAGEPTKTPDAAGRTK